MAVQRPSLNDIIQYLIILVLVASLVWVVAGAALSVSRVSGAATTTLTGQPPIRHGTWLLILVTFCLAGAVGGALSSIALADVPKLWNTDQGTHFTRARACNVALSILVGGAGGVGGSSAAIFIISLDGKLKEPVDDARMLAYIATGVLAGFLGLPFLKTVAGSWQKKLGDMAADMDRLSALAKSLETAQGEIAFLEAVNTGRAYQTDPTATPEGINKVAEKIEAGLKRHPDDRRAIMVLGTLYGKRLNNPVKGVQVLERGLAEVRKARPGHRDVADILFDIACYECILAHSPGVTGEEKTNRMKRVYDRLEESFALSRENAEEALKDPDFKPIWTELQFLSIVQRATPVPVASPPGS